MRAPSIAHAQVRDTRIKRDWDELVSWTVDSGHHGRLYPYPQPRSVISLHFAACQNVHILTVSSNNFGGWQRLGTNIECGLNLRPWKEYAHYYEYHNFQINTNIKTNIKTASEYYR